MTIHVLVSTRILALYYLSLFFMTLIIPFHFPQHLLFYHVSQTAFNTFPTSQNNFIFQMSSSENDMNSPTSVVHRDSINYRKDKRTPKTSLPRPNSLMMVDRKDLLKEIIAQRNERKKNSFQVPHRIEKRVLEMLQTRVAKVSGMTTIDGKLQREKVVTRLTTEKKSIAQKNESQLPSTGTIPTSTSMPT